MTQAWNADPSASLKRRLGMSAKDTGDSDGEEDCPDIWELENGDIAVIGRDLTHAYRSRLPAEVTVGQNERLVVIPGIMLRLAKPDIPDA
ncbi:hypothetical protein SAMN05421505_114121 [Sinosporangium album]|uniref:Uncharacterized protein n=1 Tax=Sinosporangium album TaxID=504805 RepID=A0A1G8BQH7_9ACTN|nr:hypothetical protein [Sinosporangium album]SDH35338.1 hypothetical protein SAMN05421505_114121 [Sinosporangium album]